MTDPTTKWERGNRRNEELLIQRFVGLVLNKPKIVRIHILEGYLAWTYTLTVLDKMLSIRGKHFFVPSATGGD